MLTAIQVKNAKPGVYSDGHGLILKVTKSGTKSWILRVQADGKRRDYGLGSLQQVPSLAEARRKANEWRRLAKEGLDPSVEAKRQRHDIPTFRVAAEAYHQTAKTSWKNGKHIDQWITTLARYAYPSIGDLRVDRIDARDIATVLQPVWAEKSETARRVKNRIETVLNHCHANGWRSHEAPKHSLKTLLMPIKQKAKANFPAMPFRDVPSYVRKIQFRESISLNALKFLILTAARSGEVRAATWDEIDLENRVWIIPAHKMKNNREHRVPLSESALDILNRLTPLRRGLQSLVFPGQKRKPLSDMTLTKALRVTDGPKYTVHGFRSSFRDWAAESGVRQEVAEAALSHTAANKVEAAYLRTKFLEERRRLMHEWDKFLKKFEHSAES